MPSDVFFSVIAHCKQQFARLLLTRTL